jgi:hypothetical protein
MIARRSILKTLSKTARSFSSLSYHSFNGYNSSNSNRGSPKVSTFVSCLAAGLLAYNAVETKLSYAEDSPQAISAEDNKFKLLKKELLAFLSPDQVNMNHDDCEQRGKPWNSYHKSSHFPKTIIYPTTTEQVSKIVKICNKFDIPLVPFGGGTSLEGQTLMSERGGVSLDFNHMKRIIELNEEDLDIKVEAGLGYVELNEILKPKGLWFPLDPGPGASIGGNWGLYNNNKNNVYHVCFFFFYFVPT